MFVVGCGSVGFLCLWLIDVDINLFLPTWFVENYNAYMVLLKCTMLIC